MSDNIVIYYNDLSDSDNWVTARFLLEACAKTPDTRIIWIIEPRQVRFGLEITVEEAKECKRLLKVYFGCEDKASRAFIGGLLTQDEIDEVEGFSEDDKKILALAVSPKYGPREDAIQHNHLLTLDFLAALRSWNHHPERIYVHKESLEDLENPVNLNIHFHEELSGRSEAEIMLYREYMASEDPENRAKHIRTWYRTCIESHETRNDMAKDVIQELDIEELCRIVKGATRVKYFGGASLKLLERLIKYEAASNVECFLQGGTFDPSIVKFPNQFNFALNPKAARYVLGMEHKRYNSFSSITVIPSDTTQRVKYALTGLSRGNYSLAKRFLGFNCRIDPLNIAVSENPVQDLGAATSTSPDLTAFLCGFVPGFQGSKIAYANLVDDQKQLLFVDDDEHDGTGISVCKLDMEEVLLHEKQIDKILDELSVL